MLPHGGWVEWDVFATRAEAIVAARNAFGI